MKITTKNTHAATRGLVLAVAMALGFGFSGCATTNDAPGGDEPTVLTGPTGPTETKLTGTLNAGGASSQTAAQEAWRAGFQNINPDVTVNYDPTGSGTGKQNFSEGGYIIAGTDAAYSADEATGDFASCVPGSSLVEVPVYISPIAVGFNLEGIDRLNLDSATIAAIFSGKIQTWKDPAIAALNPGATLPDKKITAVHRSDKSGTTENFTDYLAQTAPSMWPYEASQDWPGELAGEAAEKTQGVRETIELTSGAIGYLDASQATGLGQDAIKFGDDFVTYSPDSAAAAVEKSGFASGRAASDLVIVLDRTLTDSNTYPMVLVSYLVACSQYTNSSDAALAQAYLAYVISSAGQQAAAANAGSAPISATLAAQAATVVEAIR